jgi:hypothetical protein
MLRYFLAAMAPIALLWACTTEVVTVPASNDAGPDFAESADPTVPGKTDETAGRSIGEHCSMYIDCVSEANPDIAAGIITTYGSTSACWKGTAKEAAACEKACEKADVACRKAACEMQEPADCSACCEQRDPYGAQMYDQYFLSYLDNWAQNQPSACGSNCQMISSYGCRKCALRRAPEARDACKDQERCADAMKCFDACGNEALNRGVNDVGQDDQ